MAAQRADGRGMAAEPALGVSLIDVEPGKLPPAFLIRPRCRSATFPPGEGFYRTAASYRHTVLASRQRTAPCPVCQIPSPGERVAGRRADGRGMAAEPALGVSLIDVEPGKLPPAFLIRPRCHSATFPPGEGFCGAAASYRPTGWIVKTENRPLSCFSPSVFTCGESTSLIRGRQAAAAGLGIAKAF